MNTYYRIELPGDTEEDLAQVENFKVTLQKVCFYERTPCPFARTFSMDEPEEQQEVRKGKRRKSTGPAKKWKLDRVWRPEGWVEPEKVSEESASGSGSPAGSDDESDTASTPMEPEEAADEVTPMTPTTPMRQRALAALRSASAPQPPAPISTPPSRLRTRVDVDGTIEVTEPVPSASSDHETPRLRTFQAIPTDMPPSPPDSSAGPDFNEDGRRHESEAVDERASTTLTDITEHTVVNAPRSIVPIEQHVQYFDGMAESQIQLPSENVKTGVLSEASTTPQADLQPEDISEPDQTHQSVADLAQDRPFETAPDDIPQRIAELDLEPSLPPTATDPLPEIPTTAEGMVESAPEYSADFAPEQFTDIRLPQGPDMETFEEGDESHMTPTKKVDFVADDYEECSRPGTPQALQEPLEPSNNDGILPAEAQSTVTLQDQNDDDRPRTPENQTTGEDPYAAIQARIMARRSLSGTISFHPGFKSPTRQSTSSTSSTATISSNRSALSRKSGSSQQQQALASAMVKKAYNAFLGPPAHLVAIMLRIAARFANGAFGVDSMFYVESPIDSPRQVPGSYQLQGDDMEDLDSDFEEDDFGVPLNSPVRLVSRSDSGGSSSVRERKRWDVD
jgi:hypothetical protein